VEPFLDYLKEGGSDAWELVLEGDGKRDKRSSPKGYELPKRMYCIRSKGDVPPDYTSDEEPADSAVPDASSTPSSRATVH
jgi:hypothetical protein